tara:strand:+ start:2987 stop:3328 length:342 start_codon:yes stop_codon:yes gene_type:complete
MAITHTQTVSNLTILNTADNIVSEVTVKTVSVDDSDPSTLTIENEESFQLDTSGGTGASGFVAYASLTQSAILAWTPVADGLTASNTKVNAESWIESVKNPPAPTEVDKALPW